MAISTTRHKEIFDAHQFQFVPIHVIGCGAIGSRIVMHLAELGFTGIHAWDFDIVEPHNLANQVYLQKHVGQPKVEALRSLVEEKTADTDAVVPHHVELNAEPEGVVFLCVDSLTERKRIYRKFIERNPQVFRMIDVRMAATHGNVFTMSPTNFIKWLRTIGRDEDAEVSACGTSLTVGTTAALLSAMAVNQFMLTMKGVQSTAEQINVFLQPEVVVAGMQIATTQEDAA